MGFDDAVVALYQAPLEAFVAERKRLQAELKASGDTAAAARLAKLGRPSLSAWVVNQLWWRERAAFEALLAAAERLLEGDRGAAGPHRELLAELRGHAAKLLVESGHAASDPTLRRVTMTLSALAAAGGFDPDPAGALAADREPPGFEAMGAFSDSPKSAPEPTQPANRPRDAAQTREQAEKLAALQQRQVEEERARQQAERERIAVALAAARAELEAFVGEASRLTKQLTEAERAVEEARATVEGLELQLSRLTPLSS